jgi:hypothetical protein
MEYKLQCLDASNIFRGPNSSGVDFPTRQRQEQRPKVKPSVPCRVLTACKISLNIAWKSTFRQNSRLIFSPTSSNFRCLDLSRCVRRGDIWRRKWELLKHKEGEQGCTISLKAAVQLGVFSGPWLRRRRRRRSRRRHVPFGRTGSCWYGVSKVL